MIIRGGLLALPGLNHPLRADLTITNGVVSAIALPGAGDPATPAPEHGPAHEVIDAEGLFVLPGAIDPHVHFDDPGYTNREDFAHGSRASASGGVTTIIDMPCTSVPPVTSAANLRTKLDVVAPKAVVDFGFYGGVSAQVYASGARNAMTELAPNVMGFKCYFVSGMETFACLNHAQFLEVLRFARDLKRPVLLHAEDASFVAGAEEEARQSGNDPEDYYRSRPEPVEILAVRTAEELARIAWDGAIPPSPPVHIVHVSTGQAAQIIGASPYLSGETGPQYLAFTLDDFGRIGSPLKVTPPPKSASNDALLWDALVSGALDFAASDHAPAPKEQKSTGSIWSDYAGIPGSGTLLPYLFSEGYAAGRITLSRLTEITAAAAARRWGISDRKGALRPGLDGDCVLIDPEGEWTVEGESFLSKGKITPFEGMRFRGRIIKTVVRGNVVYDANDGIVAEPGYGQFITRGDVDGD